MNRLKTALILPIPFLPASLLIASTKLGQKYKFARRAGHKNTESTNDGSCFLYNLLSQLFYTIPFETSSFSPFFSFTTLHPFSLYHSFNFSFSSPFNYFLITVSFYVSFPHHTYTSHFFSPSSLSLNIFHRRSELPFHPLLNIFLLFSLLFQPLSLIYYLTSDQLPSLFSSFQFLSSNYILPLTFSLILFYLQLLPFSQLLCTCLLPLSQLFLNIFSLRRIFGIKICSRLSKFYVIKSISKI
ncbi:unnamed protein product [Acanthosepion pharaonis]|uniref:Uncharacterized protein n=1 Tax=Acanthosepion pharaonis TaxID=158019 RepID=A0A812E186_ACAPH|nr:unnamed protein product [Sepia pharaonis]